MNKTILIKSIDKHLNSNDLDLAYRKLIDLIRDTDDMSLYQKILDLTDWKESKNYTSEGFIEKCKLLLDLLSQAEIEFINNDKPILIAKNIKKTYSKNDFNLGPISLTLKQREVVGLVGENGNGKTTLLTILAKELEKTTGSLEYNFTQEYKDLYDLKTKLVYIPQRTEKWYGSLQDNLKFVLSNYNIDAKEIELRVLLMIARLGLWNYRNLKWEELSSGYKMRFELARTLLRKPEILLLDEPLANLDILAQQVILEDLKLISESLSHPIAIILSSQQLYEVEKVSHKVIFLKNGQTLHEENEEIENDKRIIELDTKVSKDILQEVFKSLNILQITYNGGMYLLYFSKEITQQDILLQLAKNQIDIVYLRDISMSSRRFFVS